MKKVLLTLSALSLMSSVALASPVVELQSGQSVAGYSYWNASTNVANYDLGKTNTNGFYAETAINDKAIISIETMKGSRSGSVSGINYSVDARFTDISLKIQTEEKIQLIVGNRSYDLNGSASSRYGSLSKSATTNKLFYGIGATSELGKNTAIYGSFIHSDIANDFQIGAKYSLGKNTTVDVNYRNYKEDDFTLKGVGAGIAYKF